MSIYLKSDDLRNVFEYDWRVRTKIITIERFNELVDKFFDDAENKTQKTQEEMNDERYKI